MDPGERRRIIYGASAALGGLAFAVYGGVQHDLRAAWIGIALLLLGGLVIGLVLYAPED